MRDIPKGQSLIFAVIALAIVFHVATIRPGHQWEGDFALYTAHARNMVNGNPYADTGYIVNPKRSFLSPKSYPPVYPAFISPVYRYFGLDIRAIKIANISTFALFLLIFQYYVRKRLRHSASRVAVVTAVAFSPWFWIAKDRILPDFLFILLIYGAILLIDSAYKSGRSTSQRYLLAIFTGLVVYLAYGTRSIGLVLIPAIFLTDLIRLRSVSRFTLIITAVFVLGYSIQNTVLHTDQSYTNIFKTTLQNNNNELNNESPGNKGGEPASFNVTAFLGALAKSLRINSEAYHQAMAAYWTSNPSKTVDNVVYVVMGLFAIVGFLALLLKNPSYGDCLTLTYVCLLLLVPFIQNRYLLPLIPLYIIYIFHGLETIIDYRHLSSKHIGNYSILGLLLVISLSYTGTYSALRFDGFTNNVYKKESIELFEFIRTNTPEDSVLIAFKPRLLAFFTNRSSSTYAWDDTPENHLDYIRSIGATHVVVMKKSSGIYEEKYFTDWVYNNTALFDPVFENQDFRVYSIR